LDNYILLVSNNPLTSAAIHFAVLGTVGEILSHILITKRLGLPCNYIELFCKIIGWGLLGIIIKYGFAGMKGFTTALLHHEFIPSFFESGIGWAFAVSVLTNIFFGPQMMLFHRIEDNLIMRQWEFKGLNKAWGTLIWFWIPAHTITFLLPKEYQIGLAALWSVILGFILGLSKKK